MENEWEKGSLPYMNPTEGPSILIEYSLIAKTVKDMKTGKSFGLSGITRVVSNI